LVGTLVAVLLVGASFATVLVLNHRGDVAAQERRATADRKAAQQRAAAQEARLQAEAEKATELAAAQRAFRSCTSQLRPLLNSLSDVDARLDVGLSQADLSNMVGGSSITYNRINIHSLGRGTCLAAGAQLETAFNDYNGTVQRWSTCIFDYSCDVDSDILPSMQVKWAAAARSISRAQHLLSTLDPNSRFYRSGGPGRTT
jgi:hypothetical protein